MIEVPVVGRSKSALSPRRITVNASIPRKESLHRRNPDNDLCSSPEYSPSLTQEEVNFCRVCADEHVAPRAMNEPKLNLDRICYLNEGLNLPF
jgi:hypothetical protein